ncbi:MAG: CCA tRNA nucleotidyltransferase [Methanobrevibacter sp.]|uniref:CCA tRNA nucleotidyltransferase n=1 Tax=Methanobrevibacter sp. TaxID=66852 RepID=UPI0025E2BB05|nr:CCA tRNA nucleotidyltransferase [Methanobrevibacter sp.]MBQ6100127.1 CCA tRNA nucleotidyltransferase [Methanobrevibacter sp.]
MDYGPILKDIKPTETEQQELDEMSKKLVSFIEQTCQKENIDAKVEVVGSVAKHTALKGKSDIDVFIAFPLDVDESTLKDKGLYLAHECNDHFGGKASHHFASHPYVTSQIGDFEVDLVPCYAIEDGSQLKSAVDRTILHTRYVKGKLTPEGCDEVLLLKRFMDVTGTYGSEFKVGGFAGYLCELLIIKYGSFEETLRQATTWQNGHIIDLEGYGTGGNFNDPLIVIDPTDENRNVGAALRLNKFAEFIQSARNYLSSDNKKDYFYHLDKPLDKDEILNELDKRGSEFIAIKFDIPEIPLDTLHPQLKMTTESLAEKIDNEEFNVFKADYASNEVDSSVILLEMASSKLNAIKVNKGPKVYLNKACNNFTTKYGASNCHIEGDFLVHMQKREFSSVIDFIKDIFTQKNISKIKVGKNIKENIIETYEFVTLDELAGDEDYLQFLDDFINPSQYIVR